jgi:uncharacterized SAM-binding protein YcdF (DUF218 family)
MSGVDLILLLVQPSMTLVALSMLGLALMLFRGWIGMIGRGVLVTSALLYLVFAFSPLPRLLILPLEERFPRVAAGALDKVDGILVLGGAIDSRVTKLRGLIALNQAAERFTVATSLAHRFPEAVLVVSNGSNNRIDETDPFGYAEYRIFEGLGIARERIIYERHSNDTYTNATLGKEVANPQPGQTWVLVTTASHMARAVGSFRKVGFDVVPYPVDYRTFGPGRGFRFFSRPSEGLDMMDTAVKEWIGLVYYWLRGRTSDLYPAPE